MENLSLEDDEVGWVFVTQQDPSGNSVSNGVLGDPSDFTSPCASILSASQQDYSDISDDDFDLPSSQMEVENR